MIGACTPKGRLGGDVNRPISFQAIIA